MTPEQLSALKASLTLTTESPTKVGWYWVAGGIWLRFVFVWTNDTCDGIFRTGSGPGVPVRDDYEGHTWTGPIDLAAMLQAIGQWRIDVEDGMEKNERLLDETIELAKEIERLRKLLAPFVMGIPDNWPEQCHLRIDREIKEDNWYEWLAYWGEDDIERPTLPTIGHFRKIAAELEPEAEAEEAKEPAT